MPHPSICLYKHRDSINIHFQLVNRWTDFDAVFTVIYQISGKLFFFIKHLINHRGVISKLFLKRTLSCTEIQVGEAVGKS